MTRKTKPIDWELADLHRVNPLFPHASAPTIPRDTYREYVEATATSPPPEEDGP